VKGSEPAHRAPLARTLVAMTVVALVGTMLAGCAVHGLDFRADKRVTIVTPRDQETVRLPVEVRWTSSIPASDDIEYAVFVDSHPMRPGQTIDQWIPSTDSCHHTPGCPNAQWLAQRFVFITTQNHLSLKLLPVLTGGGQSAEDTHNVTIVLLNRKTGERVGESAFLTTFVASGPNLND
jgi:hypothetical protein